MMLLSHTSIEAIRGLNHSLIAVLPSGQYTRSNLGSLGLKQIFTITDCIYHIILLYFRRHADVASVSNDVIESHEGNCFNYDSSGSFKD